MGKGGVGRAVLSGVDLSLMVGDTQSEKDDALCWGMIF